MASDELRSEMQNQKDLEDRHWRRADDRTTTFRFANALPEAGEEFDPTLTKAEVSEKIVERKPDAVTSRYCRTRPVGSSASRKIDD